MSLLIKNVILAGRKKDIFIKGNKIEKIGNNLNLKADQKINGKGEKAALPGFVNCHTHAAMSLLRGYADDLSLKEWLEDKIWPLEAKMGPEDIYWGTKLACLEMIKSGTTTFNDMYFFPEASVAAVKEMGLRTVIGLVVFDLSQSGKKENIERTYYSLKSKVLPRIKMAIAPHAIYTVSRENLVWAKNFAKKENLLLHIHLSETEKEATDCLRKYKMRPAEYLNKIGFLDSRVISAHSVWLSKKEIRILAEKGVSPVYNPCSNLKLVSGEIFPYKIFREQKANICLGTDGAASNNGLDMIREMKFASLLQKNKEKDPTLLSAKEVLGVATRSGARALRINAGEIKKGKLADLVLIDLKKIYFSPGYNLISDLVFSAAGDCVSDLIADGKILMREGKIDGEESILKEIKKRAQKLIDKK